MQQVQTPYYETLSAALDAALYDATARGYTVSSNRLETGGVSYGQTRTFSFELEKEGKPQKKMLHAVLYRMESGRYELTNYIN